MRDSAAVGRIIVEMGQTFVGVRIGVRRTLASVTVIERGGIERGGMAVGSGYA